MGRLLGLPVPALLVATLLVILVASAAHAYKLLGYYSGIPLYQASILSDTRFTLNLGEVDKVLLLATTPSQRVQHILSSIAVHVAPVKIVEPVATPWGVLYWGSPPPSTMTGGAPGASEKPLMLVILPNSSLEWFGDEIRSLHRDMRVEVMTWRDVLRECGKPAPPPPGTVKPDELKRACGVTYNLTKALCLISLERRLLGKGLRYLLIVGGARDSPPVYYRSPLLSTLGMRCGEYVPSDYWFADPNYDWKPEVAVGRIPFTSRSLLETYLQAARDWLSWSGRSSGLYAGGALFQTMLMLGELGVIEASQSATSLSPVVIQTLTLGDYKPLSVQSSVGDYGLYYIASHGVGDVLVDIFPHGLWGARVDVVLAPKLLAKRLGFHPGVYVTPACLSAYWDFDLIEPPFNPPSVGVALLEKGYAVDYFGSSRVAIAAIIKVSGDPSGTLNINLIGALRLTTLVASLMTQSRTIGEAVVKALASYSSLARGIGVAYTIAGSEDIAELTMLEFVLLGDPALPTPASNSTLSLKPAPSIPYNTTIPLDLLVPPLSSMAEGSLPLLSNTRVAVIKLQSSCPVDAMVVAVRRYYGYYLADIVNEPVKMQEENGQCIIKAVINAGPSFHYLILHYKTGLVRYALVTAGVYTETGLGRVTLRFQGLDLLRVTGDEPIGVYVNGRLETWIPGGVDKATVTVPASGNVDITLKPWRLYIGIVAGSGALDEYRSILSIFTVNTTVPSLSYRLLGNGVLVEAIGGSLVVKGAARVQRVAPGEYLVIPSPSAREIIASLAVGGRTYTLKIPVLATGNVNNTRPTSVTNTTCRVEAETVTETYTVTHTVTVTRTTGYLQPPAIAAVLILAGVVAFAIVYAGLRGR